MVVMLRQFVIKNNFGKYEPNLLKYLTSLSSFQAVFQDNFKLLFLEAKQQEVHCIVVIPLKLSLYRQ